MDIIPQINHSQITQLGIHVNYKFWSSSNLNVNYFPSDSNSVKTREIFASLFLHRDWKFRKPKKFTKNKK